MGGGEKEKGKIDQLTNPAKSLGFPIRPVGCRESNAGMALWRPKLVMRDGKTPGQTQLTLTFSGASLDACRRDRWMQAALDGP